MIRLTITDCPSALVPMLEKLRPHFATLIGAVWVAGTGPWDAFLRRKNGREPHFLFLFKDGSNRVPEFGDMSERQNFIELMLANDEIMTWYDPDSGPGQQNCMLLLRPNAYILLLDGTRIYVPMPDVSAHERLADIDQLAREFPAFEVAS